MRTSWPEVEVGDVCEFKYGKSLPAAKRENGPIPVYGSNGIVGSHSAAITEGPAIIVGRKGSFGEVAYSESRCWPIDTTYYIDSTSTRADLRWLAYRLKGMGLTQLNRAAAIPGLNRDDAHRQRLLLPPVDEQRRIASVLERTDFIRAKRRQVLACLDALAESIFNDMFGDPESWPDRWPMGVIGDMTESVQYGTSAKAANSGAWPILRMGNVTDQGRLDLADLKYIDLADSEVPKYTVRREDLLFNRTNSKEKVGKACVVDADEPFAFAGYLVRVRLKPPHRSQFLCAYLASRHGRAVRMRMAKTAVNQANINATEMRNMQIALPPAEVQAEFVEHLRKINTQRSLVQSALDADNELFASLQARAFRGEL
jgi:type I restriction enzyme, S subunit